MRFLLYLNIVLSFGAAGVIDMATGNIKLGTIALGFGIMNALIFFWR